MKMGLLAVAAASVIILSGCASAAESAMPTPEATPTETTPPADGGSYSTLKQLQQAYVAAGGDCSELVQRNSVSLAAESGDCNDQTVISTYISTADLSELIQTNKALNEEYDLESDSVWLTGQNWIINSPDAVEMQEKLGGRLVSF
ncbi:hypothetical protein GCM10009784_26890 [Arthrobacter parietis]|uniref:Lipoprotein n=1 Tax=Arthrobacter parietis TaxID=271434 RepID=A0ABN3B023_9MICC